MKYSDGTVEQRALDRRGYRGGNTTSVCAMMKELCRIYGVDDDDVGLAPPFKSYPPKK